ncbi:MAG TPA: hypothetical protein VGD64_10555 [Acidisarcina sp.]
MKRFRLLLLCAATCFCAAVSRADVALLVEDPAGYKGFLSDSGHLAIWISDACVGVEGRITPCNGGGGVVLSSTSYWLRKGWAAIPAQTYLDGVAGKSETIAWSDTLHAAYPEVPINYGRKYIGRLNHRGVYVLRLHTSSEQDAQVLEGIQQGRNQFHYAVWTNNCSDFARQVLQLYFPGEFGRRIFPDFGITTPHGVANRLWKLAKKTPALDMRVYYIPRRTRAGHIHDGRTKGICEAATTDVKYAAPLIFYQPLIYAAFGVCYVTLDQPGFMHRGFARDAERLSSVDELDLDTMMRIPPSPEDEWDLIALDEAASGDYEFLFRNYFPLGPDGM